MILSTSLEFNPSLNVASRDCIAALSGFAAGLSAATALAEARMAAQSAVTVRMLIPRFLRLALLGLALSNVGVKKDAITPVFTGPGFGLRAPHLPARRIRQIELTRLAACRQAISDQYGRCWPEAA